MAISLASIVTRICSRVGLTNIDVSDLADRFIEGYVIARIMTAADALEPLRQVGYFDIVESGNTLKFVARGKAVVRTLSEDDLGAYSGNDTPPVAITTRKMQDVDLPRQLRLHFRNPDRDYEDDEELSPTRLSTTAVNDVDIELALSIKNEQAAQVAEVLWADPWAGRWIHSTTLDQSSLDLEPSDCLLVPVDGRLERMRVVAIDDSAGILRKFEMVRDDDGTYSAVAVAGDIARTPTVLASFQDSELLFLDIPALRTEDADAGFYIAARPATGSSGNTWRGVSIHRSIDGGASYSPLIAISNEAATGTLQSALPSGTLPTGSPLAFDTINTLTVNLVNGSLESRTDQEVFSGANTAVIGLDGRWEVLQFANAVQVTSTQWQLSKLLRGRRGTEYLVGSSQAGDTFVLVSTGGVTRAPLQAGQIAQNYIYRAISIGTSFADGIDNSFVGNGQSLVPFAPIALSAVRQANGDVLLSWTRRDRLGQELTYGIDPQSDPPMTFSVDIVSLDSPNIVVRTLSATVENATYTNAQFQTDFGSPTPVSVSFRVFQISTVKGRGIMAATTIQVL